MSEAQKRERIEQIRKNALIFNVAYLFLLPVIAIWFLQKGVGMAGIIFLLIFMLTYLAGKQFLKGRYSDAVMDLREYLAFSRVLKDYEKPEKPTDEASFLMMLKGLSPLWEKDIMIRELSTGVFRKRRVSVFDTSYLSAPEGVKQMVVGAAVAVEGKRSRKDVYEWYGGEAQSPDFSGAENISRILRETEEKYKIEIHCAAKENRLVFLIRDCVIGSSAYKPGGKLDERILNTNPLPELDDFLRIAEIWDRGQEEAQEETREEQKENEPEAAREEQQEEK